jgi:hypothetical protein
MRNDGKIEIASRASMTCTDPDMRAVGLSLSILLNELGVFYAAVMIDSGFEAESAWQVAGGALLGIACLGAIAFLFFDAMSAVTRRE